MTIRRAIPILLAMLLTGCSLFSRSQSRFYSLERIPGPVANVRGTPIGIGSVELPPGFDRREIVARTADHRLDVRGTELWAASLEPMVRSTLAVDLAGRLPEGIVALPGVATPNGPMGSIEIVFGEIAAGPDAKVVVDAWWSLRQNGTPDVTRHEHIAVDVASLDSANIASGMSQALATLADRIVAGLTARSNREE